jgi:hypothetical protein
MSSSLACVAMVLVFGRGLTSRAEAGLLLCRRCTFGSSPTYALLLFLGGTEPGRVVGIVTCTICLVSALPAGVSGRDIGLDGTMRGPGGALVARGGNSFPRAPAGADEGDAMMCGLGFPRAAGGMPVAVAGRLGLSLPTPYSESTLLSLSPFGRTFPRASGGKEVECAVFGRPGLDGVEGV